MGFTLSILLIIILFFPGFSFLYGLKGSKYDFKFADGRISEFFIAFMVSSAFHTIGYFVIHPSYIFKSDIYLCLILGENCLKSSDNLLIIAFNFVFLIVIETIVSGLLGFGIRRIIFKYNLDARKSFFRLRSEWYYFFTGKILDQPGKPGKAKDVLFISVYALCQIGHDIFIYRGLADQFFLNTKGELDRFVLIDVYRRKLDDDSAEALDAEIDPEIDERYYRIKGEFLIIQYSNVLNIHFSYTSTNTDINYDELLKEINPSSSKDDTNLSKVSL